MTARTPNDRKPTILVIGTTFPAQVDDGTPQFVLDLATAMADDYRITILTPRVPGAERRERLQQVSVIRFPYAPRRWEGLAEGAILPNLRAQPWRVIEVPLLVGSMLWHAFRFTKRQEPAAIHAHWILPAGLVALILKRLFGIPYVVTVHGSDAHALRGRIALALKRRVLNGADMVAPVSHDIAQVLGLPCETDTVTPMGVDVSSIADAVGDRLPQVGRLLFVGRLADKKGLDVLLRAMCELPSADLIVIGDGPERESLETLVRHLDLESRVAFRGKLPKADVYREMKLTQALVIPSKVGAGGDKEGTPIVLAEAMAAGVPVIASRIGGLAERIDNGVNGMLVNPDSVENLGAVLRKALHAPRALEDCGKRGKLGVRGSPLDLAYTLDRYRGSLEAVILKEQRRR